MYHRKKTESVFVEILNKLGKNTIVGCVYKHPDLPIKEFTEVYLSKTLEKFSLEKKNVFIMGDFNINLLNCESNTETSDFFDTSLLCCDKFLKKLMQM